jgi:hypothetical protein
MFIFGVLFVLPGRTREGGDTAPSFARYWIMIVLVFAGCSLFWTIFILPWDLGQFSLYYLFKYLEGLTVIYIATRIPLNSRQKRILHNTIIAAGMFVALYSIPQYGSKTTELRLVGDKYVVVAEGALFGPLSRTYFHIGMFSVLSFAMTLAMVFGERSFPRKLTFLLMSLFAVWPALACGSRAALFAAPIVLLAMMVQRRKQLGAGPKYGVILVMMALTFCWVGISSDAYDLTEISLSLKRLTSLEGGEHSLLGRLYGNFTDSFSLNSYMIPGLAVLLFGGGFYVAPVDIGGGVYLDRIGFGIHNAYLFALEQGGAIAFFLFLKFLLVTWREQKSARASEIQEDGRFAAGMSSFMVALLLPFMLSGLFWLMDGTGNFCFYVLLLLVISTKKGGGKRDYGLPHLDD